MTLRPESHATIARGGWLCACAVILTASGGAFAAPDDDAADVSRYLQDDGRFDLERIKYENVQGSMSGDGLLVTLDPTTGEPIIVSSDVSGVATCTGDWTALGAGPPSDTVRAIAIIDDDIIIGGSFENVNGVPNTRAIARYVTGTGTWEALGGGLNDTVYTLRTFEQVGGPIRCIWAGGDFTLEQGGTTNLHGIASWGGSAWNPIGDGFNDTCFDIEIFANTIVAVGAFNADGLGGGSALNGVARWQGTLPCDNGDMPTGVWEPVGDGFDRRPYVIKDVGGVLYAGGEFTENGAGTVTLAHVARWAGPFPPAAGGAWASLGTGLNGHVRALAEFDGDLIAGGDFTETADGVNLQHLGAWDGEAWSGLKQDSARPDSVGVNGSVRALANYQCRLYVGGLFTRAGSIGYSWIVEWAGSSRGWQVVGGGVGCGGVLALEPWALPAPFGGLLAGGAFREAGGDTDIERLSAYHPCDCDDDEISDACAVDAGATDCNCNDIPDVCDIASGYSVDVFPVAGGDGVPDECQPGSVAYRNWDGDQYIDSCEQDCNQNGRTDEQDIFEATSADENNNGIPDECEGLVVLVDCNENGVPDDCDITEGTSEDANENGIPDECESPPCPGDTDGDGQVSFTDLLTVLSSWGPCVGCPADFNGDDVVGFPDLLVVLTGWGPCPG